MNKFLTVIAITSILASPAWGSVREAALATSADTHASQTSMFAGATYRLGLDRRTVEQRGRASLKLAGMSHVPGSTEIRFGEGLELTGGQTGKPALHLAGQDIGQLDRKANLSTGAAIAIGVGVVLVVGIVVIASTKPWECYSDGAPCD